MSYLKLGGVHSFDVHTLRIDMVDMSCYEVSLLDDSHRSISMQVIAVIMCILGLQMVTQLQTL